MKLNYLAFAIPLFLLFTALEYWVARRQQKEDYFHFDRSIVNISIGIAERLADLFTVGIFYYFYTYIHTHFAVFTIKPSVLLWLALFLCTDFVWYWYHRLAHEISLLWSVHVVHHQSEDFNYTVSARITVFQALVRVVFWSVLPWIGFPPEMITSILLIHGAYPFFIHTRTIGKLGILEYILVTPSHHRVHHASDEHYLDKNYGDVLIIWDKIFGTFVEEKEEPHYGLTKPLNSHSFLWQHFHFILELLYTVKHTQGWGNKIKIIFGGPDLVPEYVREKLEQRFLFNKSVNASGIRFKNYVIWQIGSVLLSLFLVTLFEHQISLSIQIGIAFLILLTLINCGAILEQRKWVFYLEYTRLITAILFAYIYFGSTTIVVFGWVFVVALICFFTWFEKQYLRLIYGSAVAA
ncbi:sterol desaturase family protein [Cytophagaceae bacterium DM2B3-1]|uniref:Sterol desaturase family protein n=1 Tax=Xanthocytophaga flava TaxID=3048013 RepID=A0ABT7CSP1_9BACT|nr:sterol desaturase family protein [Xanthocytophaga flavus]MDJ1471352.1 sterol desaturase family protein [Xanthocytophaga flavus]MDJ1496770.1 sterol desaturase family protein [Xanthocytophaga flavus]